jgi:TDG/mug DNA glycosylase family protein
VSVLRDYLRPGLDVVFVGINPGVRSAAAGHHYAGPSNLFWPLLYESGLVSEPLTYGDDARVLEWNIGLTNMVSRSSPGLADLSMDELRAGAATLRRKLLRFQPAIACFNGKKIFEVFAGRTCTLGLQPERVGRTQCYVMPSTSPRGASYQRADKLAHFQAVVALVEDARRERVAS